MRDIETIDGELRLLARVWGVAREMTGRTPSTALIDQLLDERFECSALFGRVADDRTPLMTRGVRVLSGDMTRQRT